MKDLKFVFNDRTIKHGDKTVICGIVNVTPDSFSDGGKWANVDDALRHSKELVEQGATMLDIGGESTRPGSSYVQIQDEIERVVPVIEAVKKELDVAISVDTWKADVAIEAIKAGADIINDITGFLGDHKMAEVVADSKAGAILMFNPVIARPEHKSAKIFPKFGNNDVFTKEEYEKMKDMPIIDLMNFYLKKSLEIAEKNGIEKERILLDPGIGFGLTKVENLELVNNVEKIYELGCPIFLGVSRKRFIVNMLNEMNINVDEETEEGFKNRDFGSAILSAIASYKDVEVVRTHSVEEHKIAIEIAHSLRVANSLKDMDFDAYKNK
jgi:dihydropteroate synthase